MPERARYAGVPFLLVLYTYESVRKGELFCLGYFSEKASEAVKGGKIERKMFFFSLGTIWWE